MFSKHDTEKEQEEYIEVHVEVEDSNIEQDGELECDQERMMMMRRRAWKIMGQEDRGDSEENDHDIVLAIIAQEDCRKTKESMSRSRRKVYKRIETYFYLIFIFFKDIHCALSRYKR